MKQSWLDEFINIFKSKVFQTADSVHKIVIIQSIHWTIFCISYQNHAFLLSKRHLPCKLFTYRYSNMWHVTCLCLEKCYVKFITNCFLTFSTETSSPNRLFPDHGLLDYLCLESSANLLQTKIGKDKSCRTRYRGKRGIDVIFIKPWFSLFTMKKWWFPNSPFLSCSRATPLLCLRVSKLWSVNAFLMVKMVLWWVVE